MSDDIQQDMINLKCGYFGGYDKTSNFGKVFGVIAKQSQDIDDTLLDLEKIQNIDEATGKNLDIFADNLRITRGGNSDEILRQLIKIEKIANKSKGQIATIKEVALLIFGDSGLNGILETWQRAEYHNEPAAIVIRLSTLAEYGIKIPNTIFERIVLGGVRVYYEIIFSMETIGIQESDVDTNIKNLIFLRCGTFETSREMGVIF